MAVKLHTRRLTQDIGRLSMRASVQPGSLNEEERTVDVVWTTGARVMRGFFDRFWEELSLDPGHVRMGRLDSGAPLLNSHLSFGTNGVVGVVERASLQKKRGVATVRFGTDEESDKVYRKVADGILRNISVGYRVHRFEQVEGGKDKIPVFRATDWEPMEISVVAIGADAGASVREYGAETNPCEFLTQERHMEEDEVTPKPVPNPVPEPTRADDTGEDVKRAAALARKEERERIAVIHRTAGALGLDSDVAQRAIDDGTSADSFRASAIDSYEKAKEPIVSDAGRGVVDPGEDARDKWLRGAEHWLIQRAAVDDIVVEAAKRRGEALRLDPGEFRGMSLMEIARAALERSGTRTAGMDKMRIAALALTQRGGGYASTGDFPVLLENVMHKTLLASYGITPDTWSRFCATGSVSDFRAHNRYRMGSFGRLQPVNEHGEFENKAIPDGRKETISAGTYGNIISLTRQALINDDMSSFSRLATMLGRAARLSIEVDVYGLLALNGGLGPLMEDGLALFDAAHLNVSPASALSVQALDEDRQLLASQRDESDNDFLDLRPRTILVPLSLGGTARVLNDAEFDTDEVGAGQTNKFQQPNRVRGLFRDIVDTPRMTGTRRYLFEDAGVAPVIEVAYLDGQREPFLELRDGWRVDGVEWKIRLDYGVSAVDYRGAITNAG